jgi:predicted dinucleotide-binding enzyme
VSDSKLAPTRVGVLGSGVVGRALARGFADRSHEVMIGSREPQKEELVSWLNEDGTGVQAGTFAETAEHGELLVLAVLGLAVESAIDDAGSERFAGKVVIDVTNPLDFSQGFPPTLGWAHTDSAGEHVQRALPDAKVVKAFNTIGNAYFVEPCFPEGQPTMFIAGDDDEAKAVVTSVLADFGWPPPADVGGIEGSRLLEELAVLWVVIGGKRGAFDHGFRLLTG